MLVAIALATWLSWPHQWPDEQLKDVYAIPGGRALATTLGDGVGHVLLTDAQGEIEWIRELDDAARAHMDGLVVLPRADTFLVQPRDHSRFPRRGPPAPTTVAYSIDSGDELWSAGPEFLPSCFRLAAYDSLVFTHCDSKIMVADVPSRQRLWQHAAESAALAPTRGGLIDCGSAPTLFDWTTGETLWRGDHHHDHCVHDRYLVAVDPDRETAEVMEFVPGSRPVKAIGGLRWVLRCGQSGDDIVLVGSSRSEGSVLKLGGDGEITTHRIPGAQIPLEYHDRSLGLPGDLGDFIALLVKRDKQLRVRVVDLRTMTAAWEAPFPEALGWLRFRASQRHHFFEFSLEESTALVVVDGATGKMTGARSLPSSVGITSDRGNALLRRTTRNLLWMVDAQRPLALQLPSLTPVAGSPSPAVTADVSQQLEALGWEAAIPSP